MTSKSGKTFSGKQGGGSGGSSPVQSRPQFLASSADLQIVTLDVLQKAMEASNEKMLKILDMRAEKTDQKIQAVVDGMATQTREIRQDIALAFKGLAEEIESFEGKIEEVRETTQQLDSTLVQTQNRLQRAEDEVTILQYRDMEFALRFRGVKEDKQEDLRDKMVEALAQCLGDPKQAMNEQIDKVYRVNSWVAKQRHLPRDIVIYFATRNIRNQILQATYKDKLQVEGQEVMTLKEVPPKMLRARKEYAFLVNELRKRELQYRWEVPVGLVVNYMGERYRLNSVWKAKDFFVNVLKADESKYPSEQRKQQTREEEKEELLTVYQEGAVAGLEEKLQIQLTTQDLIDISVEPKDQRQTRSATAKRKGELQQQHQQQCQRPPQDTIGLQAVGGARPKSHLREGHLELLKKLERPKNGN